VSDAANAQSEQGTTTATTTSTSTNVRHLLGPDAARDLAKSGISAEQATRFRIRSATAKDFHRTLMGDTGSEIIASNDVESASTATEAWHSAGLQGYIIPYFNMKGETLPDFWRVKLTKRGEMEIGTGSSFRYLQPRGTPNHIYITPGALRLAERCGYLVITEGEKKAIAATLAGVPTVAVGGIYNWTTRSFQARISTIKRSKTGKDRSLCTVTLDIPEGLTGSAYDDAAKSAFVELPQRTAPELSELTLFAAKHNLQVIIIFDSDPYNADNIHDLRPKGSHLKTAVQEAAFMLAVELAGRLPIQTIKLCQLPFLCGPNGPTKTGLDDLLMHPQGTKMLEVELEETLREPVAFPAHPDLKRWIDRRLEGRASRSDLSKVASTVIAHLDLRGNRYVDAHGELYYFDSHRRKLYPVDTDARNPTKFFATNFGSLMAGLTGLTAGDVEAFRVINSRLPTQQPIRDGQIARGVFAKDDAIYVQISDSRMLKITAQGISIVNNGKDQVIFLQGQVEPVDEARLQAQIAAVLAEIANGASLPCKWLNILRSTTLGNIGKLTSEESYLFLAAHFYISPWLLAWRGAQLPIEVAEAEPGSGKTSLYNLRTRTIYGRTVEHNTPVDVRSWYADIAAAPGIWLCDNVGSIKADLLATLSNEMCRLVTSRDQSVKQRELYTTSRVSVAEVHTIFSMTAVRSPFKALDFLERSINIPFRKIVQGSFRPSWVDNAYQDNGGREGWIAHHVVALHKFLTIAARKWNHDYASRRRLMHYEQCMMLMAEVFGLEADMQVVMHSLGKSFQIGNVAQSDAVVSALCDFAVYWLNHEALTNNDRPSHIPMRKERFTSKDIVDWAQMEHHYATSYVLRSAPSLAGFIKSAEGSLAEIMGLRRIGKAGVYITYEIHPEGTLIADAVEQEYGAEKLKVDVVLPKLDLT
jgi:hypothetical protein